MVSKMLNYTVIIIVVAVVASGITYVVLPKGAAPGPSPTTTPTQTQFKAAWMYSSPIGDIGWTFAHDQGRLKVVKMFPWMQSVYVEGVAEADAPRIIDRLVTEEKASVVFTDSFGFQDATIEAGKKYPKMVFYNATGFIRSANVGTYDCEVYQLFYLNGLMAGALTKTNKIGFVGAQPIPTLINQINAFALGVREANPSATVSVKWLFSWYDPAKAKEAAESLVSEGCDALNFVEDTPAVVQVAEDHTSKGQQIYVFSHYSPMLKFGPNSVVSGHLARWDAPYAELIRRVYSGTWDNGSYWWLLTEGAVELGADFGMPVNPKFIPALQAKTINHPMLGTINIYNLVMTRLAQMSDIRVTFDPWDGPVKDQKGVVRIKAGERPTSDYIRFMDWYVEGVIGEIPK